LWGVAAPSALAQQSGNSFFRSRHVAVTERPQPAFDPETVRVGSLDVNSSLGLGARYSDNIYAQENGAVGDTVLTVAPQLTANTNWSVHALSAGLSAEHRSYVEQDTETATDSSAFVGGRLDVTRDFSFGGTVTGGRFTEQRNAPASQSNAAEPTEYAIFGAEVSADFQRDRIAVVARLGQSQNDFDDVAAFRDPTAPTVPVPRLDQDFRDHTQTYINGRASYATSPDLAVFVQGDVTEIDFDDRGSVANPDRDATRTNVQAGVDFEFGAPFRGDIAVGYIQEEKKSRVNADGLSVNATLKWFPTQLTTVTFSGLRSIYDPGLAQSATVTNTSLSVRGDHELLRNVLLFWEARGTQDEFQDIDRQDDRFDFSAGVGYKLNRNARIEAAFTRRSQDSSGVNRDRSFDENIIGVTLRLYP